MGTELNKSLSICIPTYNGEIKLRENLMHLLPIVSKHNLPICISDNASTDGTEQTVKEFQERYPYIFYDKNQSNEGYDRNCYKVLRMSKTQYAWLVGNDDLIVEATLNDVLIAVYGDQEYILINVNTNVGEGKRVPVGDTVFYDYNEWMLKIGSHLTHMSGIIFNGKIFEHEDAARYYDTDFLHLCLAYNGAVKSGLSVKWISATGTILAQTAKNETSKRAFYLFVLQIYKCIKLFNKIYSKRAKKHFIETHFAYLNGLYFILFMRECGQVNLFKYLGHLKAIHYMLSFKMRWALFISCFLPKRFLHFLRITRRKIINRGEKV
ncbi:hypothetical protein FACS1894211_07440 [Clostridia bacterium]|nr:hypothetical protein FACS1894211_07440 [Clostridia bacterium]